MKKRSLHNLYSIFVNKKLPKKEIAVLCDCSCVIPWRIVVLMRFGEYYIDKISPKEQPGTSRGPPFWNARLRKHFGSLGRVIAYENSSKRATRAQTRCVRGARILGPRALKQHFSSGILDPRNSLFERETHRCIREATFTHPFIWPGNPVWVIALSRSNISLAPFFYLFF